MKNTYLSLDISQMPTNLGGTPKVKQNLYSCICNLAGPGAILAFCGAEDICTKNC